jgi:quercetin 2,3-dioxygenase
MLTKIDFKSLGHANHGWLDTRYHFSFADYRDPQRVHWGALRVWNDDVIAAKSGFPQHPHSSMEIITYVMEGAITHKDSLGNQGRTEADDVQVMSAGTGIQHAEWNEESIATHLFQIWIIPSKQGGPPRWAAAKFPKADRAGELVVLASGRPQDEGTDALMIRQDAALLAATLTKGQSVAHELGLNRFGYIVPAKGAISVNGIKIEERSAMAIAGEPEITIESELGAEFVLTDVPPLPM